MLFSQFQYSPLCSVNFVGAPILGCPSCVVGGAESASTGKGKCGNEKHEIARFLRMENASTANVSMNLQGWEM